MFQHFIAEEAFTYQLHGYFIDSESPDFLTVNRADVFEITKERKFLMESGWYYLIRVNNKQSVYVAYEDLQYYVGKGKLLSALDLDLAVNCLEFQVNQSLDDEDKASFTKHAEALAEAKAWKQKLETYSCSESVNPVL